MSLYGIDALLAIGFVLWAFVDTLRRDVARANRRKRLEDLERWYAIEGSEDIPTAPERGGQSYVVSVRNGWVYHRYAGGTMLRVRPAKTLSDKQKRAYLAKAIRAKRTSEQRGALLKDYRRTP